MKNSEIHKGLPQSELRDYIATQLVKIQEQEFASKKEDIPYDKDYPLECLIKDCEAEIAYQNKKIEFLKQKQAILEILKMTCFEEFDISDETEKDLHYSLWLSFIGTKEEYNQLIDKLRKN